MSKSLTQTQVNAPSHSIRNGFALFSMFFGAGNVIFPLIIGQTVKGNLFFSLCGLMITAIIVPFSGVISTSLFQGDYQSYFRRVGAVPGFLIILLLFALIGPFGGIPRLIGLSYSSLKVYLPKIKLFSFSAISCIVILLFSIRKKDILKVLGLVLTPILLISLCVIIVKGTFFSQASHHHGESLKPLKAFFYGIKEGYNTMDLLASFFFASMVYKRMKSQSVSDEPKSMMVNMLKASVIGATLLALVYVGFSYVAATFCSELSTVSSDQYLGKIGQIVLGKHAGIIVCLTIVMSCLTTAIALSSLCADFLCDLFKDRKPSYPLSLLIVLILTWGVSTLEFSGIVRILSPVLQICYPSLLAVSILNIFYKVYGFKHIKIPVFVIFIIMLISSFF
ncbi:MAG: Branched-chain amino acid transport system 2 carrier protein [Chlamydiia bacterium]|nr:Branched-chain amino acid transport system 2 carrier protein [Chlamydiia bacterium]